MKIGRTIVMMSAVGMLSVACGQNPAPAPAKAAAKNGADVAWMTDFQAAKKMAAEKQLPILADFSGSDWCHWCIKLSSYNIRIHGTTYKGMNGF